MRNTLLCWTKRLAWFWISLCCPTASHCTVCLTAIFGKIGRKSCNHVQVFSLTEYIWINLTIHPRERNSLLHVATSTEVCSNLCPEVWIVLRFLGISDTFPHQVILRKYNFVKLYCQSSLNCEFVAVDSRDFLARDVGRYKRYNCGEDQAGVGLDRLRHTHTHTHTHTEGRLDIVARVRLVGGMFSHQTGPPAYSDSAAIAKKCHCIRRVILSDKFVYQTILLGTNKLSLNIAMVCHCKWEDLYKRKAENQTVITVP